jgi:hypothetical protein
MKKFFNNSLLISAGVACMALASACGGSGDDDDDSTGGTGGTGGSGSGNVTLIPGPDGWIAGEDNDIGVQGSWYPYGDQYGDGAGDSKCTKFGNHMPSECAQITSPPPPPAMGFPNSGGAMHTEGTVEKILPCVEGSMAIMIPTSGCPTFDYSNMWGAGIGFDLNADKGEDGGAKHMWNPAEHGVIGFEFTIDTVPLPGLRVEFPMLLQDADAAADFPVLPPGSTTDSHSAGAPYWGAQRNGDQKFPNSPVMAGVNRVNFNEIDIQSPKLSAYVYDPSRMLGIQFHVPTNSTSSGTYSFTISNITFIRQ